MTYDVSIVVSLTSLSAHTKIGNFIIIIIIIIIAIMFTNPNRGIAGSKIRGGGQTCQPSRKSLSAYALDHWVKVVQSRGRKKELARARKVTKHGTGHIVGWLKDAEMSKLKEAYVHCFFAI